MAYSKERRAAVIAKMLPPSRVPIPTLSRQEGISEATLYTWRGKARARGQFLPDANAGPDGWTTRDKFAAVVEAPLDQSWLSSHRSPTDRPSLPPSSSSGGFDEGV